MTNHEVAIRTVWIMCIVIAFVAGMLFGGYYRTGLLRNEAVKAGAAHWAPGEHGEAEFTWGPREEAK